MTFHVERIILSFTDTCKTKDLLAEMTREADGLYAMLGTSQRTETSVCSRGWRQAYLNFLLHRLLSSNYFEAMKIKRKYLRFITEGLVLRRDFNQADLRCMAGHKNS